MHIEAGRFKGRTLPPASHARPAGARLRKSLFSALGPRLEGARVLDLFAGAGGFGLEALSRGAAEVVLVERDAGRAGALERWLRSAGAEGEARVVRTDALAGRLPPGPFDLIFADPPYAAWSEGEAAGMVDRALARLAPEGRVVLKVPARLELPRGTVGVEERRRRVGGAAWVVVRPPGRGAEA